MTMIRTFALLFMLLASGAVLPATYAQAQPADDDEPLFDALRRAVKREYLSLSLLTQVVADVQFDRPAPGNGFSLAAARIGLSGRLDKGFSYFVQTEFVADPVILDARISYTASPLLIVDAGVFKAPFSAEFLIPASGIDFVNRAQMVTALAPNRQIGVGLRGRSQSGFFGYRLGVFNGNRRQLSGNDNNQFLYVARGTFSAPLPAGRLALGVNVAHSEDDTEAFQGTRTRIGGDLRLTHGPLLLAGEFIYSDRDALVGLSRQPWGLYATAGYMLVPDRHQLLLRLDTFTPDIEDGDIRSLLLLGYNFWPTRAAQIQVNYLVPLEDAEPGNHQVLVNFQLAF